MYRIATANEKGCVLIATEDILPGATVFYEELPLFYVSNELVAEQTLLHGSSAYLLASYLAFKLLNDENQQDFLKLYGPTNGHYADEVRLTGKRILLPDEKLTLSVEQTAELELLTKINSICRLNSFQFAKGSRIWKITTRMSNSCLPNCCVDFSDDRCTCRAILPVKKGEELTIEYNEAHRWKPTHMRRMIYAQRKDFTCHCPRCDAEADDTREFDCHDPQCPGSHFACQPLSAEPLLVPELHYTGVEYVEPHLLPCTVCHRAAPLRYQQDMFALEVKLPAIVAKIEAADTAIFRSGSFDEAPAILADVKKVKFPSRHRITLDIARITNQLYMKMNVYWRGQYNGPHKEAVLNYLRLIEHFNLFPTNPTAAILCDFHGLPKLNPEVSVYLEADAVRKGLRMHMILAGRDNRNATFNSNLAATLQRLPSSPASAHVADCTECMFCGESPLRAALTLSRCGRCRQVAYCSVGCQKAHWPLHKKGCKKTV